METDSDETDPYTAPDGWAELVRQLAGDAIAEPRVILAQSRGRAAYQSILDARVRVTRVSDGEGLPERISFTAPGMPPGNAVDLAAALYSTAVRTFLDGKRGDTKARVKAARVRLQVFDGDRELGQAAVNVARSEFELDEQTLFESPAGAGGEMMVTAAMRMVSEHSREMSRAFVALARTVGDQAQAERAGLIEYAHGALAIVKEAGEIHSAAIARAAEVDASGGVWATVGGQTVLAQFAENLGAFGKMAQVWAASRMGKP